jgi:hypothetical protein
MPRVRVLFPEPGPVGYLLVSNPATGKATVRINGETETLDACRLQYCAPGFPRPPLPRPKAQHPARNVMRGAEFTSAVNDAPPTGAVYAVTMPVPDCCADVTESPY